MYTFHRFLVGVDEKGLADHAAHAAARLAAATGAAYELLHAVPVPSTMWFGVDKDELARVHAGALLRAEEGVRERLGELERHVDLSHRQLTDRLVVEPGKPAKRLLERARESGADVIFLGVHERRGKIDFGGTARKVLHRARCSVWVQPVPWIPIERILVPVDLDEGSEHVLAAARDLARSVGAAITVLHAFERPVLTYSPTGAGFDWDRDVVTPVRLEARARLGRLVETLDWQGVEHETAFVDGPAPEAAVLEMQAGVQLIVMGASARSELAGIGLGAVAYHVMRRAEVAVLALRAAAD